MTAARHSFVLDVAGGPATDGLALRGERLVVDFVSHRVRFDLTRSDADQPGLAIGRYELRADASLLAPLLAELRTGLLARLAPPGHGGPGSNAYSLRYEHGDDADGARLTSRDAATRPEVRALFQAISDLEFRTLQHPVAALGAVAALQGDRLHVTLENRGSAAILVRHPAQLAGTLDEWCGVRVAELPEEKPGFTSPPLVWTQAAVPRADKRDEPPPALVLAPKASQTFLTERLPLARGKTYVAQAIYSSYVDGRPVPGALRIRGATFSANVVFARGATAE